MPAQRPASIDESAATSEDVARFFPQLEIIAPLGSGPLGPVFQARDPESKQNLALHLIATESADTTRVGDDLAREAERLANFRHPHVSAVFGFGDVPETCGALHFLLAERVEGLSLRPVIESKRLAPRDTLAIVCTICETVQAAHDHNLVHGDVTPENVVIDKSGQIKLVNLGLKPLAAICIGNAESESPADPPGADQTRQRDDVFALGALLYEMLTGEPPCGNDLRPSQRVDVDRRLDMIVQRALTDDPQHRYQQAIELKTDIGRLTERPAQTAEPAAVQPEAEGDPNAVVDAELVPESPATTATARPKTAPRHAPKRNVEPRLTRRDLRRVRFPLLTLACGLAAMALTFTPWVTVDDKAGQFNDMQTYVGPIHIHETWLVALSATRLPYTAWDSDLAFREQGNAGWSATVPNSAVFFLALAIVLLALLRCMKIGVHAALQIIPLVLAVCGGALAWLNTCISVQCADELHYAPLLLLASFSLIALGAVLKMLLAVCRTLFGRIFRGSADRDFAALPAHGLSA